MNQVPENLLQIRLGHVKTSSLYVITCGRGSLLKGELPFPVEDSSDDQIWQLEGVSVTALLAEIHCRGMARVWSLELCTCGKAMGRELWASF